jgi:cytoskeletal protein RodZ
MGSLRKLLVMLVVIGFAASVASPSWAWTRSTSGTYTGKHGNGSFRKNKTWDKDTKTGSYSSTKNLPNGKTISKSGTVTKNADGSYTKAGTVTGPDGKVSTVNKTITKNADGSRTVNGTVTGPDGKITTVNKTVQKTDPAAATIAQ